MIRWRRFAPELTYSALLVVWMLTTGAMQDSGVPKELIGGSGTLAIVVWAALGGVKLWKELKGEAGDRGDEGIYLAREAGKVLNAMASDLKQQTLLLEQLVTEGRDYQREGRAFMRTQGSKS